MPAPEIVSNAIAGDAVGVSKEFDTSMIDRVRDIIAGKRTAVSANMFGDQLVATRPGEDETIAKGDEITDLEDEESEESEEETETPEEEEIEDESSED